MMGAVKVESTYRSRQSSGTNSSLFNLLVRATHDHVFSHARTLGRGPGLLATGNISKKTQVGLHGSGLRRTSGASRLHAHVTLNFNSHLASSECHVCWRWTIPTENTRYPTLSLLPRTQIVIERGSAGPVSAVVSAALSVLSGLALRTP